MKKVRIILSLLAFMFFMNVTTNAQMIYDFKVKNAANEKDRTMMLDLLRNSMYNSFKQVYAYKVDHFKVSQGYAWLSGVAERKDGKKIVLTGEQAYNNSCCNVGVLFVKRGDKWFIEDESRVFPSDVYGDEHEAMPKLHPRAPIAIFDEAAKRKF
jgi:hypothetical protein